MPDTKCDIGLVGLAVMGQNLVLNMNDHNYSIAVYNRTSKKTEDFLTGPAKGRETIVGTFSIEEFVKSLKRPRKVMLMVKAGEVVDKFIDAILPLLEAGDVIIDGGNSNYMDSNRRENDLRKKGILYIGTGVSGGEEGARTGPSMMPGGNDKAWPLVKNIFQDISAHTESGEACCDWVGDGGAGHYVKMVHNGIEYGDMQIISEAYHLMKEGVGMSHKDMHKTFSQWDKGDLNSYLIEITADILDFYENNEPLVEKILDKAGQKGTGKWTGISSLELGIPVTLIGEAVFARCLSSLKEERVKASSILHGPSTRLEGNTKEFIGHLEKALLASKIISYAQGFMLMKEAAKEYDWKLNYGSIALMWRGGCIIRSSFLGKIKEAYDKNPDLENLLLDSYFSEVLKEANKSLRYVVAQGAMMGIPLPALSSALSFYDGYRREQLPANMLQAMRDYFGAHTYQRIDKPKDQYFHTNWTGTGGHVSSSTYNA